MRRRDFFFFENVYFSFSKLNFYYRTSVDGIKLSDERNDRCQDFSRGQSRRQGKKGQKISFQFSLF